MNAKLVLIVALALLLSACGGASQASVDKLATQVASLPTQAPFPTLPPTATPINFGQLATMMAPTPIPPTATPVLTATIAALQTQIAMGGTPVVGVTSTPTVAGATLSPTQGAQTSGAVVTTLQNTKQMGAWKLEYFTGATTLMKGFVFVNPDPTWEQFPNVDWPKGNFKAANGLEYGQELSSYCQQDQRCDIVIAARSYRSITADYKVDGIGECKEGGSGIGCALLLFNVGNVSSMLRDQHVDMGHTVTGLYWNGDKLDQAISALASHIAYRMIGPVKGMPANPGANCSVPSGCKGVNITFAILSGNELLVLGNSVVNP